MHSHILWDPTESYTNRIFVDLWRLLKRDVVDFEEQIQRLETGSLATEKQSNALVLLKQFPLSSPSGLALMSLCECYPRISDKPLRQKLLKATLKRLPGILATSSTLLNLNIAQKAEDALASDIINKLSSSFVCAPSLDKLDVAAKVKEYSGLSVDCLGEAAQTKKETQFYVKKYQQALLFCQKNYAQYPGTSAFTASVSMSIKLSALATDFNVWNDLAPLKNSLKEIFSVSDGKTPVNVTIDAEEAHRADLQREVVSWLVSLKEYSHLKFSIAQQAYLTSGLKSLSSFLEKNKQNKLGVRIVKGAYYDYEVRESQKMHYTAPVFSEKQLTDASWLLMGLLACFNSNFTHLASHSPRSLASFLVIAKHLLKNKNLQQKVKSLFHSHGLFTSCDFLEGGLEFQYLYGMGGFRQKAAVSYLKQENLGVKELSIKAYAPIGGQKELLPYLVRRLLENGVNNSVWQSSKHAPNVDPVQELVPAKKPWLVRLFNAVFNRETPLPIVNAKDCSRQNEIIRAKCDRWWEPDFLEKAKLSFETDSVLTEIKSISEKTIGTPAQEIILNNEVRLIPVKSRIAILQKLHAHLIDKKDLYLHVLIKEAKKHPIDAQAEWQEALDFISYYLSVLIPTDSTQKPSKALGLSTPDHVFGEFNHLYKVGVPNVLCISPWNFPLAITLGQLTAAICAGVPNLYLKPSPKLQLVYKLIDALFEFAVASQNESPIRFTIVTGEPKDFEQLLRETEVVLFTGSTAGFSAIKQIASKGFNRLIGETGGVNCAIIDGSIEPGFAAETLAKSAFIYSGQKCSCIRVAFVDKSIYTEVVEKLKDFDLKPGLLSNSHYREPIDESAKKSVIAYVNELTGIKHQNENSWIIEQDIKSINWNECFGPVLQIVCVDVENQFEELRSKIQSTKYGLTFTLLSKDEEKIENITKKPLAGNQYINRVSTGAVVQAQSFGGFKSSGTGPKIGTIEMVFALSYDISTCMDGTLFGGTVGIFENKSPILLINPKEHIK